jgi:hypothetical protein
MVRFIAAAGFALAGATSVQAMTPAPLPRPDGLVTQAAVRAVSCGPFMTRVRGRCVWNWNVRRREVRTRPVPVPAPQQPRT